MPDNNDAWLAWEAHSLADNLNDFLEANEDDEVFRTLKVNARQLVMAIYQHADRLR